MEQSIKVAIAQVAPIFLDKEKTIEKACQLIRDAGENKAQLIVFPEAYVSGYPDWTWLIPNTQGAILNELYSKLVQNALTDNGPELRLLAKTAKESNIHVAIGANERNSESSNSSLYNSLFFINNKGHLMGKHRKLIPTGAEKLIWGQGDGSTLKTYATKIGVIGGLICWENRMPAARMALYKQGLQLLISPTWDKSESWITSMKHIAIEGGVYVLSACMALHKDDIPDEYEFKSLYPKDREWINGGHSVIIDPKGNIIKGPLSNKQEIMYADLDLDEIIKAKRLFDVSGHYSRPDVFKFKIKR